MNTTIQQLQPCYDFMATMDETEYIKSNPKIMESISRGDEQIASGSFDTTKLEDLWN